MNTTSELLNVFCNAIQLDNNQKQTVQDYFLKVDIDKANTYYFDKHRNQVHAMSDMLNFSKSFKYILSISTQKDLILNLVDLQSDIHTRISTLLEQQDKRRIKDLTCVFGVYGGVVELSFACNGTLANILTIAKHFNQYSIWNVKNSCEILVPKS